MLWAFCPEHLSVAFLPIEQEFGNGVPVQFVLAPTAEAQKSPLGDAARSEECAFAST